VKLPTYMPDDAHAIVRYNEISEVLRSPSLRPEPSMEAAPINGGVLTMTHGADHTRRRRIMNRLVRPDAIEHFREFLLVPAMQRQLQQLYENPAPDGTYRTDLVPFTMLPFISFAAALAGFDMAAPGRDARLLELTNAMADHHRIKWFPEDHDSIVERGLEAKRQFEAEYFGPALAQCPYRPGQEVPREQHDLMSVVAAELDPAWHDENLKVRETFTSIFAAGVGSSATMMTNSLEELSVWLPSHPEAEEKLDDLYFLAAVLQETLRLNPSPPVFGRVAAEDLVLSTGREIKAGEWVALFAAPANREPELFGADADEFNPLRELPVRVPRYGVSFGIGTHQCLGLRVVLGNDGVGSHAHVLRMLLAAGVRRDPDHEAVLEPSERKNFTHYPVIFDDLERVVAPARN
jgi:cytochrome P450